MNDVLSRISRDVRVNLRRQGAPDPNGSCVVYWMQRAQRGRDNLALDVAVDAANALDIPVVAFFAPIPFYPHANLRHYSFLQQGIADIAADCERRGIGFVLRRWPEHRLAKFCSQVHPALVIGDENPLRESEHWRVTAAKQLAANKLNVPLWTVDADVIVPSRLLEKSQYAARIIRPRLKAQLTAFLVPSRNPRARRIWNPPANLQKLSPDISLDQLTAGWPLDRSVAPVTAFRGGSRAASKLLREFLQHKLGRYERDRGHPELDGTSSLSPYLHFGHISPVTVALAIEQADVSRSAKDAFLDELITWRELAVNFVRYNPQTYDSFDCAEPWAHATLAEHARDDRPYIYTPQQLERAETHDALWNAAQRQMLDAGWMHNVMRMYWAKKILEWSKSPAEAYRIAIELNDRYFLDGRDPNGYAGIAWAIAGKFDRPWFDRPIFGKIRYMSAASTGRKFDSRRYIEQWSGSRNNR